MKRTKEQIEQAKAAIAKKRIGRPTRKEPVERLTVYLPLQVSTAMREKLHRNRDTVSNYVTRLVEKDLREVSQ
jgi:type II secretory pathway component PulC